MSSSLQNARRNHAGECPTCGMQPTVLIDVGVVDANLSYERTGWFAFVTKEDGVFFAHIDKYLSTTVLPSEEERVETHINIDTRSQLSTQILQRIRSISVGICPECNDTCDVIALPEDLIQEPYQDSPYKPFGEFDDED